MTDSADDLKSRLGNWLRGHGYPLEMVVARAFHRHGFRTIQSDYYTDAETGKLREIDVSADMMDTSHKILVNITFCIECKLAKDKPWVMFVPCGELAGPASVVQRIATGLGHDLLESICDREDIQKLPVFVVPQRGGYGVIQAFTAGEDVPYAAVMTAVGACFAKAEEANKLSGTWGPICEILLPAVVIDGKLFECYLADAGEVITAEIPIGTLVWRNPAGGMPHTIVPIVTLAAIDDFVQGARESSLALLETCESELSNLSKSIGEGPPVWTW